MHLIKMPNWKGPEMDGIQEFWFKRFTSQHQRLPEELNENIQALSYTNWLVKSRTVLIQKNPAKGNAVGNCRPIACLNLLWKLKNRRVVDMPPEALRTRS